MKAILLLCSTFLFASCFNAEKKLSLDKDSKQKDKIIYSLGAQYAKSIEQLDLDKNGREYLLLGISDYFDQKLKLNNSDIQHLSKKIDGILAQKRQKIALIEKSKGEKYVKALLSENSSYQITDSGLVYKVIKQGRIVQLKTAKPFVSMHFESYHLENNKQYESTKNGNPRLMPLRGIFKAWREAFGIAGVGGQIEVIAPPKLTYGDNGAKPYIEPGEYLKFNLTFTEFFSKQPQ